MKLQIPPGEFKAYLFDCDGTIADSMSLHYKAWLAELAPWGCEFPHELHLAWAGAPTQTIIERLNRQQGLAMPAAEVASQEADARPLSSPLLPSQPVICQTSTAQWLPSGTIRTGDDGASKKVPRAQQRR